jgi:hypothetical protein
MKLTVPNPMDHVGKYLRKCPPAVSGQGGHTATFRVALALVHGHGLTEEQALVAMQDWNRTCQPPWSEAELRYKISSAIHSSPRLGARSSSIRAPGARIASPRRAKVDFKPGTLARVAAKLPGAGFDFVLARSPLCPETQTPATFLHHLYRPGECVIVFDVFKSQGRHVCQCVDPPFDAAALDHLRNGCHDGVWFQCNPVDGEFHPNPRLGGKRSRRSEESVTSWRYMVLESDEADAQLWLAALVQMPLRIAAIYTSGGRSIHALVRIDATSKADWDAKAAKLKPLLTVMGADPAAMTAVRLTRLPGCFRGQEGPTAPKLPSMRKRMVDEPLEFDAAGNPIWTPKPEPASPANLWTGGKLQELIYLNPKPELEPICRKPTRKEIYQKWLADVRRRNEGICA